MLPSPAAFASRMSSLGLNDSDDLVVYDGSTTNLSAPRVWWMFRTFGHDRVAVLDGGLLKWRGENRPLDAGTLTRAPGRFTARLAPQAVRDLQAVRANMSAGTEQLIDARSRGRFAGTEPEPRPGIRGGHVPGSRNLPYADLVTSDGTMRSLPELRHLIESAGIDLNRPVVATCGSGTSACALVLALHLLGHQAAVYDGAWSEWAAQSDTPIASGPAPEG
jgi:thiosulfate/3-mercaptopyruvate sulfurtransferase